MKFLLLVLLLSALNYVRFNFFVKKLKYLIEAKVLWNIKFENLHIFYFQEMNLQSDGIYCDTHDNGSKEEVVSIYVMGAMTLI